MIASISADLWTAKRTFKINDHDFTVLMALAEYANDFGEDACPGVATLADITGKSIRQVQRILTHLVECKVIAITGNFFGGRGKNTIYRLAFPIKMVTSPPQTVTDVTPLPPEKGDTYDSVSEIKGDIPSRAPASRLSNVVKNDTKTTSLERTDLPSVPTLLFGEAIPVSIPKKGTPRGNPDLNAIIKASNDALGIEQTANYGTAIGLAKTIQQAGLGPADMVGLVAHCRHHDRQERGVDMRFMAWEAQRYRDTKRNPVTPRRGFDPDRLAL